MIARLLALTAAALAFLVPSSALAHQTVPQACTSTPEIANGARLALVFANSRYDNGWDALKSPRADVAALANSLSQAGFTVAIACDADVAAMRTSLSRFAHAVRGSEVAMLYFAGHGIELEGLGYVVPIGAPPPSEADGTGLMPIAELRDAVRGSQSPLVFLDACRTELATGVDEDAASLANASLFSEFGGAVGFAAAQGLPAYDSAPPSYELSPFAESLTDFLPIRGLELSDFFRAVHKDVQRRTELFIQGPQQPWLIDRLPRDFYFSPPLAVTLPPSGTAAPPGPPLDIDISRLESGDEFGIATELLAERGLDVILAHASAGDSMAQYLVSYMLRFGVGVERNEAEAHRVLELSAATGNPAALTVLGHEGILFAEDEADEQRSKGMLQQAAAQGFARAHHFLGDLESAARDGDSYSAFLIAERGDLERGLALLQGMAEAGDDFAENWLCELAMIRGRREIAETSCRFAARAGFRGAQTHYAKILSDKGNAEGKARWAELGRSTIYFEFDSAQLTGINYEIVVQNLVEELARRPWVGLTIETHTDQFSSPEYSIGYSSRMAQLVKGYLMGEGVDASKIASVSYGSLRPNSKSYGLAPLNRRVEIVVEWADDGA